jgi:hypothetical protein
MFGEINVRTLLDSLHKLEVYKFKINSKDDRKWVKSKILRIIHDFRIPNTHYEFDRALGNAIHHGECPVKCKVYIGHERGSTVPQMVCVISDSGSGFDYHQVIQKFMSHQHYYHNHGYGFRCYGSNRHLLVDWANHGRKIILHYK